MQNFISNRTTDINIEMVTQMKQGLQLPLTCINTTQQSQHHIKAIYHVFVREYCDCNDIKEYAQKTKALFY